MEAQQEKYQEEKVCGGRDDDKMIKIILTRLIEH
jgi:hypothetical protein